MRSHSLSFRDPNFRRLFISVAWLSFLLFLLFFLPLVFSVWPVVIHRLLSLPCYLVVSAGRLAVVNLHSKETWANSPTLLQHAQGDRNWKFSLNVVLNSGCESTYVFFPFWCHRKRFYTEVSKQSIIAVFWEIEVTIRITNIISQCLLTICCTFCTYYTRRKSEGDLLC